MIDPREINSVRWTWSIDVAASFRRYLHNIIIYREVITWCILVTFSLLCYEFCLDDFHGILYRSSHIYQNGRKRKEYYQWNKVNQIELNEKYLISGKILNLKINVQLGIKEPLVSFHRMIKWESEKKKRILYESDFYIGLNEI